MKEFFKNYTLGSLVCSAIGIALLINPHIITDVLNTAIGIVLIVWGVLGVIRCIADKSSDGDGDINIFSLLGNIALGCGGIYVFKHTDLLERVIIAVLGIYLICSGLPKLIDSIRIKNELNDGWKKPLITSGVTTLLGIAVLAIPSLMPGILGVFMRVVGGLLLVGGVGNFIGGQASSKLLHDIRENHEYKHGRPAEPTGGMVVDISDFSEK